MIKSIFSFFASGFFRKLGQISALIVVGLIALVLFNNSNIKLPRFLQFGLVHVNASEKITLNKLKWRIRKDDNGTYSWSNGEYNAGSGPSDFYPVSNSNHDWLDAIMVRVGTSSNFKAGVKYRVSINLQSDPVFGARPLREIICGASATSSWSNNESLITSCTNGGMLTYSDGNKTSYYIDVTPSSDVYGLQIQIYFNRNLAEYGPWLFQGMTVLNSTNVTYNKDSTQAVQEQTTTIINQTNEINNSVNNINDTLKDTDVSDDVSDAGDFFNDFELSSDTPLTNILMMPLTFINLLLNYDSNSDFCTTYHSKQICLPNGSLIWGRTDSLVVAFKSFFNLVVGGFLFYRLLRFTAKTIENALDPTIVSEVSKEL